MNAIQKSTPKDDPFRERRLAMVTLSDEEAKRLIVLVVSAHKGAGSGNQLVVVYGDVER